MFAHAPGLEAHMRLHVRLKRYPCRLLGCKATFTDSSNRRRHEKTVAHGQVH
jgi:hypothetical protein